MIESEKGAAASFLELSPALRSELLKGVNEGDRDPWTDGSTIARYITELAEEDIQSSELEAILDHIEVLLSDTSRTWMRRWIKVAIFESVQNRVANERLAGDRIVKAEAIYKHLGKDSQGAWRELNNEWGNSVDTA